MASTLPARGSPSVELREPFVETSWGQLPEACGGRSAALLSPFTVARSAAWLVRRTARHALDRGRAT